MLDEEPREAVPSSSYTDQAQIKGGVRLNVPCSIQKNIQRYREAHDSYLRMVSHETVGSFNPWALAERYDPDILNYKGQFITSEFSHSFTYISKSVFGHSGQCFFLFIACAVVFPMSQTEPEPLCGFIH